MVVVIIVVTDGGGCDDKTGPKLLLNHHTDDDVASVFGQCQFVERIDGQRAIMYMIPPTLLTTVGIFDIFHFLLLIKVDFDFSY